MSITRATVLPDPEPFSLGQLRNVIPPHCFERSYVKSFSYLFRDLLLVGALMYVATYIDLIPWVTLRFAVWMLYWFSAGVVMTGVWVIAHECGHQAFSPSLVVNDTVGCILHTALLVPYWSWKYSHGQHHANSNSMDQDSVFVPHTDLKRAKQPAYLRSAPRRLWGILEMVLIGWPAYLWFNVQSHTKRDGNWYSHFNPFCPLWKNSYQRTGVIASDISLLVWCWVLYRLGSTFGWTAMIQIYGVPYLWVNFWLITITYLQHTDVAIPKYYTQAWSWMRGALGTIDRDYGILNGLHHHIADTHVLHHIFSKIPHYHAQEATRALLDSGLLKEYYIIDNTPWYIALWRNYRDCWFVRHDQATTWFESSKTKKE